MNSVTLKCVNVLAIVILHITSTLAAPVHYQTDDHAYTLAVEWSKDGNSIAAVGIRPQTNEGYILIVDAITGQINFQSQTTFGGNSSVAWSPDDRFIAVGSYDQTVKIIDVKSQETITTLAGHRGVITSVDWNSLGTRLITSSSVDQQVILWDTTTYQQIRTIEIGDPWAVAFSPNDKEIAVGGLAGLFVFPATLDLDKNQNLMAYQYANQYVGGLAWSHNGNRISFGTQAFHSLVTGKTSNPQVYIVDSSSRALLNNFEIEMGEKIFGIAWSPKDDEIATYSTDGLVRIWEIKTGILSDSISANAEYVETGLGFSPYGGRLAYGGSVPPEAALTDAPQIYIRDRTRTLAGGAIQISVPAPSPEKLQAITQACGVQPSVEQALTAQINADNLQTFTDQVTALTDAQIPPGCKADLLAVAAALLAKGQ